MAHRTRLEKIGHGAWECAYATKQFFYQLLRVDLLRLCVAAVRFYTLTYVCRRMRTLEPRTGDVGINTVHHNMRGLKTFKWLNVTRSDYLVYPLSVIRTVSHASPILSVGPRSEGELLNLMGQGFRNVRGLDLISYSPWIDLGDMHAMPYEDNRFGAVLLGWVLAYSDNRVKAAREAVRVVRNGGVIAVGAEYTVRTAEELSAEVGYQVPDEHRLASVADILALFGDHVDRVYFSHDIPSPQTTNWQLVVHFSVKK